MTTTRKQVSIELIDNWHKSWKKVLKLIERTGADEMLHLDIGGWLSARQILCAAFVDNQVAGFLAFHIEPDVHACIRAQVDAYAVERAFAGRGIEAKLLEFARKRAKKLRCGSLDGFDLGDDWSIA